MSTPREDLTGRVFDRLTVLGYSHSTYNGTVWRCRCSCGTEKVVPRLTLMSKHFHSCGCYSRERVVTLSGPYRFKNRHGHANRRTGETREWRAWQGIKARCLNPKNPAYSRYGGRGITVCAKWRDSYEAFLADMGSSPGRGYSIDRIDNGGHYEPGNCRWATAREQTLNRRPFATWRGRPGNPPVELDGVALVPSKWARISGVAAPIIRLRLKAGWAPLEAIFTPNLRRRVSVPALYAHEARQ